MNDAEVSVRGAGQCLLEGTDKSWDDAGTAREWRKHVRAMVQPSFLEVRVAVEILQSSGLLRFAEFSHYAIMTPMILCWTECESAVPELAVEQRPPDCMFDGKLGFECSEMLKARAADWN